MDLCKVLPPFLHVHFRTVYASTHFHCMTKFWIVSESAWPALPACHIVMTTAANSVTVHWLCLNFITDFWNVWHMSSPLAKINFTFFHMLAVWRVHVLYFPMILRSCFESEPKCIPSRNGHEREKVKMHVKCTFDWKCDTCLLSTILDDFQNAYLMYIIWFPARRLEDKD